MLCKAGEITERQSLKLFLGNKCKKRKLINGKDVTTIHWIEINSQGSEDVCEGVILGGLSTCIYQFTSSQHLHVNWCILFKSDHTK